MTNQESMLKAVPFVLFADVVLLTEIDEIGDGLGGQQGEAIDNLNLRIILNISTCQEYEDTKGQRVEKISLDSGALLPPQRAGLFEQSLFFIVER